MEAKGNEDCFNVLGAPTQVIDLGSSQRKSEPEVFFFLAELKKSAWKPPFLIFNAFWTPTLRLIYVRYSLASLKSDWGDDC